MDRPLSVTKDLRGLELADVAQLREWLAKYRYLENPEIADSELLLEVLVRRSREYEGDMGVFALADELG